MSAIDRKNKLACGHGTSVGPDVRGEHVVSMKGGKSVVVIPWHPHHVSAEETFSLKSIRRFSEGSEVVIVAPEAEHLPPFIVPDRIEIFPADCFKTFEANNRLMTSIAFYERFAAYQQMILVHVDVLLLKPLSPLLSTPFPWSYVGAPWIGVTADGSLRLEGVGNGGFSVRRIPDFLSVLRSPTFPRWPRFTTKKRGMALWTCLLACRSFGLNGERISHLMNRRQNIWEDVFWSKVAPCLSENFTVAPVDEALAFGFEMQPKFAHEKNRHRLPYGIHAWWRHDAEFVRSLWKTTSAFSHPSRPETAQSAGHV